MFVIFLKQNHTANGLQPIYVNVHDIIQIVPAPMHSHTSDLYIRDTDRRAFNNIIWHSFENALELIEIAREHHHLNHRYNGCYVERRGEGIKSHGSIKCINDCDYAYNSQFCKKAELFFESYKSFVGS